MRNARLTLNDAGFEDQLGNDVNDIIDWGVQVLAPELTDAVESFIIVCTPLAEATIGTTGTEEETSTTGEQTAEGSGLSSALLGVPDSADPGTTSDGVQAAEVIAGVTDSPVFVGGGERRRA